MAKHKAPTQVTIASTDQETPLHEFVQRTWKPAAAAAVAVIGLVLFMQWRGEKSRARDLQSWETLGAEIPLGGAFGGAPQVDSPGTAATLADDLAQGPAGPWAKALEVGARLAEDDFDGAQRALDQLTERWPDHPLAAQALVPQEQGPPRTIEEHLAARAAALKAWEADHPELFANPPLPEGSPRVRLNTNQGPLVLGLYADYAPLHVENFLKHCREGFYDGVKFHRVIPGQLIQGGDPNTVSGEQETWGQGGPGYTVEMEIGNVWHFKHALSAAKTPGATESSGSQFFILADDQHAYDGDYTVFGMLVEGQDTLETLVNAPVVDTDRPQDPAVIESVEIL